MKKLLLLLSITFVGLVEGYIKNGKIYNTDNDGFLKVGFDIDNTVVDSSETFKKAQQMTHKNGKNFYAVLNKLDHLYSNAIEPTVKLIKFYRAKGHDIYFVSARGGQNGQYLAQYLSDLLDFNVKVNTSLFFSPEKKVAGFSETTKQAVLKKLKLDLFYGDSDNDIVSALLADVEAVRILRSKKELKEYPFGYFGNIEKIDPLLSRKDYKKFKNKSVGPFGETIYPIPAQ